MKNYTNPQPTLMDKVQAIALARSYANGTFHSVAYRSERILSEKYAFAAIVKISVISGRFGIDWDNVHEVMEARENGAVKGSLKGFVTIEEDLLYRSEKTGETHIRFTTYPNANHETFWFENGKPVTLEELLAKYPASAIGYRKPSEGEIKSRPLMLNAGNIIAIN